MEPSRAMVVIALSPGRTGTRGGTAIAPLIAPPIAHLIARKNVPLIANKNAPLIAKKNVSGIHLPGGLPVGWRSGPGLRQGIGPKGAGTNPKRIGALIHPLSGLASGDSILPPLGTGTPAGSVSQPSLRPPTAMAISTPMPAKAAPIPPTARPGVGPDRPGPAPPRTIPGLGTRARAG